MKKYTIKEFAEGEKAVKIENEEQWNKLNKVHKLTDKYCDPNVYGNDKEYSIKDWYERNDWEVLEFSQLDFKDEFVVGKWYEFTEKPHFEKGEFYAKFTHKDDKFWYSERISKKNGFAVKNDWARLSVEPVLVTDLSEIQQYLPSNHPDLIKKDTFVLPEKWFVRSTPETRVILVKWRGDDYSGLAEESVLLSDKYWQYISLVPKDYTEITFEQFKIHVLKESTMKKEIIGYKLKEEFLHCKEYAAHIGEYNNRYDTQEYLLKESDRTLKCGIIRLKEAGVLDLWFEPVFAPDKPKLPIINGNQCVDNGNKTITCGCTTKSFDWILGIDYAMGEEIDISGTKVSDKEIRQIVEYINNK